MCGFGRKIGVAFPLAALLAVGVALWELMAPLGAPITLAGALAGQAQSNGPKPDFTIKEHVHLVIVPVTVKDRHGALLDDLSQDEFTVFECGHARPVE